MPIAASTVAAPEDPEGQHPVSRIRRQAWRHSRAETKSHCVTLPGQHQSARDFDRRVAEFPARVAVLNGFTAPGTPIMDVAGQARPGMGNHRPSTDVGNRAPGICHARQDHCRHAQAATTARNRETMATLETENARRARIVKPSAKGAKPEPKATLD